MLERNVTGEENMSIFYGNCRKGLTLILGENAALTVYEPHLAGPGVILGESSTLEVRKENRWPCKPYFLGPFKSVRLNLIAANVDQFDFGVCRDLPLVFLQQLWSMLSAGTSGTSTEIEEIISGCFWQIGPHIITPDEIICQAKKLAAERLRFESSDDCRLRNRRALL